MQTRMPSGSLLYLSRADIRALQIKPSEARRAVLDVFDDCGRGLAIGPPKLSLDVGPGHVFQAMPASSASFGMASLKWIAMAPVPAGLSREHINGIIILNDYESGQPLAVMDGNEITLLRTAALSAAAATFLAPANPTTVGMIGCGAQAHAHLLAIADVCPTVRSLLAFSRSRSSADALRAAALKTGLSGRTTETADEVLELSDIVITTVPGARGLQPFLDARCLKREVFVSAVDLGRSWLPQTFLSFDLLVTDSLSQMKHPHDVNGTELSTASFTEDLITLSASAKNRVSLGRKLFCFKGFALCDLAVARVAFIKATERRLGIWLER